MNQLIDLRVAGLIALAFTNLALLGQVKAVDPSDTFYGLDAFNSSSTGISDSAFGYNALFKNTTGGGNTATGAYALLNNTTGGGNTATGFEPLLNNTTGYDNTATGAAALLNNASGSNNTANGEDALLNNKTGSNNTATGVNASYNTTIGTYNTADGVNALYNNTTGSKNVAIGANAGKNLTTGSGNVCIGVNTLGLSGESNTIRIGSQGTQTATYIAGIHGVNEGGTMIAQVTINSNGRLGTQFPMVSSRRFKKEIKRMDNASEAVLALKPVTFQFKNDSKGVPQFGLIAEEVEKVNPDLITRDDDGKPYTVRYDAINAMLLNEFLKEHRKVEQQRKDFEAALAEQQKQIEALTAGLQRVSAQLVASKATPQIVASNTQ